jgi:hypothetical protein
VRASASGARWPVWDANGNLHYWQTGENVLQSVHTREVSNELTIDAPQPVWSGDIGAKVLARAVISVAGARYDVDATGTRFLVLENATDDSHPDFSQPLIVLGWPNATRD